MDSYIDDLNLNKDELPKFQLPHGMLEQLFEFSGSDDGNSGYLLIFVNQDGGPMVFSMCSNQITALGLRKAAEKFLLDSEEAETNFDSGLDDQ